jgi:2-C-methyl-D-erythritol 4-phosphate cytidylyltransferase
MTNNIAVIFAGGTGKRMNEKTGKPKQFLEVHGKPIIVYTAENFQRHHEIDAIYIVCISNYIYYMRELVRKYSLTKVRDIIPEGVCAMESIRLGLKRASEDYAEDDIVLIHDGVRPIIDEELISANISTVKKYGTAITCAPCTETIAISQNGDVIDSVTSRPTSYRAAAPQTFRLGEITKLHSSLNPDYYSDTIDCATLCIKHGANPRLVLGNSDNVKVTLPEDYYIFKSLIEYRENQYAIGL